MGDGATGGRRTGSHLWRQVACHVGRADLGKALGGGFFPPEYEKLAVQAASKALDKLVEEHVPSDISVKQHLAFGKIHRKVLRVIEQTACDLVVMGSHK